MKPNEKISKIHKIEEIILFVLVIYILGMIVYFPLFLIYGGQISFYNLFLDFIILMNFIALLVIIVSINEILILTGEYKYNIIKYSKKSLKLLFTSGAIFTSLMLLIMIEAYKRVIFNNPIFHMILVFDIIVGFLAMVSFLKINKEKLRLEQKHKKNNNI